MVITNDIFVAAELCDNPDVKVTVTDGDIIASLGVMVGPRTLSTISDAYVSKAFIDITAVDLKFGYSMQFYDEVVIIKEIMKMSREVIALADHLKLRFIGIQGKLHPLALQWLPA